LGIPSLCNGGACAVGVPTSRSRGEPLELLVLLGRGIVVVNRAVEVPAESVPGFRQACAPIG